MLEDNYRHKGMRRRLVNEIMDKGFTDERILEAFLKIPRHFFFERAFLEKAYENDAFPIGEKQTISQPSTVAYQTWLLEVKKGDKILEVGTGSGYQAAILACLGAEVFTIERHEKLHLKSSLLLEEMGFRKVHCYFGDGYKGSPKNAPFDKVVVTAGAPYIPDALKDQLKLGGIIVIPVDRPDKQGQVMVKLRKTGEDSFDLVEGKNCRFVPMLEGISAKN